MSTNPFKAGEHNGMETYYVTVDDRICRVASFDRAQCKAALQVPHLQKTVAAAVQRRMRHLDKITTVLHFMDHGQDFLRWDLDAKGKVIDCGPFQGSLWIGRFVVHPEQLWVGELVRYRTAGDSAAAGSIRYPLVQIERVKGGAE